MKIELKKMKITKMKIMKITQITKIDIWLTKKIKFYLEIEKTFCKKLENVNENSN